MKPVGLTGQLPSQLLKGPQGKSFEQEKARLQKATKEFEAFFRYQMLKAMRQTVPKDPLNEDMPLSNSQGQETFLDMMDMELSKAGNGGHGSISDILYRSTEKLLEAKYAKINADTSERLSLPVVHRPPIKIAKPAIKIDLTKEAKPLASQKKQPIPIEPRKHDPHMQIMLKFGEHIEAAAKETKLDSALIASVIKAESGGNPNAHSCAGAKGLMQLVDSTAQDYGVTDAFDPEQNIKAGSRFLKALVDKYQDLKLALAAYNAGPGNVAKYGGLPPFKETRAYVQKVMDSLDQSGNSQP